MVLVGHRAPVARVGRVVGEEPEVLGAADRGRAHEADRSGRCRRTRRRRSRRPARRSGRRRRAGSACALTAAPDQSPNASDAARAAASMSADLTGGDSAEQRTVDRRMVVERVAARARRRLDRRSGAAAARRRSATAARSPWRSSRRTCGWLPCKLLRAAGQAVPVRSAITVRRWFSLIRHRGSISWYSTLSIIVAVASPR